MKQILLLCLLGSLIVLASASTHAQSSKTPAKNDAGTFPKPGEWPAFRRTGTLQSHSPLKGKMTHPAIAWKQFVGGLESRVVLEAGGKEFQLDLPNDEVKLKTAGHVVH